MTPELTPLLPELKSLVTRHVVNAIDYEKRHQYAEARRNQAYYTSNQYVVPVVQGQTIVDWRAPSGNLRFSETQTENAYDYVRNQIRGDGKKLVAVLGQRAPNVEAMPDRLDDDDAMRTTKLVNKMLADFNSQWDVERMQRLLTLSLWKFGSTFGHTRWTANGRKYGWREEPKIEEQMVEEPGGYQCSACGTSSPDMGMCPGCGKFLQPEEALPPQQVPQAVQTGVERYPKGAVEASLESVLRITTPFYSEGIDTLPWLWVEREEHQAIILAAYNDGRHPLAMEKLWKIRSTSSDVVGSNSLSTTGRAARDAASSPNASYMTPRRDRWSLAEYYLTPEMFMYVIDDTQRNTLLSMFPDGVKITFVEDDIIDVEALRLADEWSVCFPEPNDSMYPDPLCKDYMQAQDLINDALNIGVETAERAIGFTVYDPQVINKQYFKDNPASPGEMIPAVPGVGKRLSDSMWNSPRPELPADLLQWGDHIVAWARENVGIQPALFGGEGPVQTAYQASRQLNQALMQLSTIWNEMRSFWRRLYMNAIRLRVANDPDFANVPLQGWHLDVEEAIPLSWGQLRDFFILLLEKGPDAWQMFGLTHPSNLGIVSKALGLKGWTTPNEKERVAILDTIKQLLQEAPLPPPIDPMTGAPLGPPQPSIPPDDLEFLPPLVVDVVRHWRADEEGREAKQTNPPGYANVMAWGRAYMLMMAPPPMPGGGPAPGGPAPEGAAIPGGETIPEGAQSMAGEAPPPPPSVAQPPETLQ